MGEKGAVVSKQRLSDDSFNCFRACVETPKVEQTALCSETDADALWQVLFWNGIHSPLSWYLAPSIPVQSLALNVRESTRAIKREI